MKFILARENDFFVAVGDKIIMLSSSGTSTEYRCENGESSTIVTLTVSDDGLMLSAGFTDKAIYCWDVKSRAILGKAASKKIPTSLAFASVLSDCVRQVLLVSDKAGDVWGFDAPSLKQNVLLAGHTASVITDMIMHGSYIVTADRDEKIRVTNFPEMVTIQSYCLGHTSVVTSLAFTMKINGTAALVSSGWDGKILLWNYFSGKLLDTAYCGHAYSTSSSVKLSDILEDGSVDKAHEVDSLHAKIDQVDEFEKSYDEIGAGEYPLKVVASAVYPILAVIFKGSTSLKIYSVESAESIRQLSFGAVTACALEGIPIDLAFAQDGRLIILLEEPHFVQIISVNILNGAIVVSACMDPISESVKAILKDLCQKEGHKFFQQLVFSADDSIEKGIRKHALDKPFNRDAINTVVKKGSKRSRRRHRTELSESSDPIVSTASEVGEQHHNNFI